MREIQTFSLAFTEPALEQAFIQSTFLRTLHQGRTAMVVGMFVYILCGLLDPWFVPPEYAEKVWMVRLTALTVPTTVLLLTFTPYFQRVAHQLLALVGLAAGCGYAFLKRLRTRCP